MASLTDTANTPVNRVSRQTTRHFTTVSGKHIRLLPSRKGIFFLLATGIVLLTSLNFQNNLGVLTSLFFLSCLLVSTFQTWSQLRGASFCISKIEPVFCGSPAHINMSVSLQEKHSSATLTIQLNDYKEKDFHITEDNEQSFVYSIPTEQRGEHVIYRIRLSNRFPLGVAQALATFTVEQRFIVFPVPANNQEQALQYYLQQRAHVQNLNQSDYAGMRNYTPGDPFKLINWKSVASGKGLYVNDFSGNTSAEGWIDWDDYPEIDSETRLSLMTRSVIEHEKLMCNYGLRLPGISIRPQCGFTHMKQCLTALACFKAPSAPRVEAKHQDA